MDCFSRGEGRALGHDQLFGRFGATVAIGLTIFVLSVVTIIICFTCSCCCLYKMCRRPRRKHAPTPHPSPYWEPSCVQVQIPG